MSENTPPESPSSKDAPRLAALKAVQSVIQSGANLQDALNETRSRLKDPRDRAFHHQLVMTVIRHFGEIDTLLDVFLERRPHGQAAKIIHILYLGIAQVLYLDVPVYAAASTTVDLVRQSGLAGHAKLANAIMRRIADQGPGRIAEMDVEQVNTPPWLWQSWCATYGEDITRTIAAANTQEPRLDLSVKSDPDGWAEKLEGELLPTGSIRLPIGGRIDAMPGFEDGEWWVQDAAAALPVKLLGDVEGKSIVDLCAAPGGKTMQLIAAGAHVTAIDRSKKRLKTLHRNLYRTHQKANVITAKAEIWKPVELVDGILLDAPCSATGTLRRNPDIMFQKGPEDITSLTSLQDTLIDAAVDMVKPGGVIIYCTCSLQDEEGPARIAAALSRNLPIEIVPIEKGELPGLSHAITPEGALRTLPGYWAEHGGMDGFYAARLRKLPA
ncbi:MAG: MFS transporter [Rhodospirillales bacterium]|jgi:16S rRNA (cytosine967-C5)-methyltransferase|nr:MFS transporter [Rhodospirillales bacterium]